MIPIEALIVDLRIPCMLWKAPKWVELSRPERASEICPLGHDRLRSGGNSGSEHPTLPFNVCYLPRLLGRRIADATSKNKGRWFIFACAGNSGVVVKPGERIVGGYTHGTR